MPFGTPCTVANSERTRAWLLSRATRHEVAIGRGQWPLPAIAAGQRSSCDATLPFTMLPCCSCLRDVQGAPKVIRNLTVLHLFHNFGTTWPIFTFKPVLESPLAALSLKQNKHCNIHRIGRDTAVQKLIWFQWLLEHSVWHMLSFAKRRLVLAALQSTHNQSTHWALLLG